MILVTGATGFIGKHLLDTLVQKEGKENVLAFGSKPIVNVDYLLHNNYKIKPGFFENEGYNNLKTIIHAGAYTPKNGSEANDINKSFSNIESTFNLINALPDSVEHFIFLSTLDVYGECDTILNEQSYVNPVSLYAQSKRYCEQMIEAWAINKNKNISILRIGHVFGPGEEAYKKIIPVTISRLLKNMAPQIWGEGNDLRSFIYIDNVVELIIKSLAVNTYEGPVNIVSERAITINALVNLLIEISGLKIKPEHLPSNAKVRNLVFDASKMKRLLGAEFTDLKKGLTGEWNYMNNLRKL